MTYEQWLAEWPKYRDNYLPAGEEPTEKQLRAWYWAEVGQYRTTRQGRGSFK